MNFEIPQTPVNKTGGSIDTWKPFTSEWSAQPWTIDAMVATLAEPTSTLKDLAEAMDGSVVIRTSARDMSDKLKEFCWNRYGGRSYEAWRAPLLVDTQKQKEWLADPNNRVQALHKVRDLLAREAILEKYKSMGMEPTTL